MGKSTRVREGGKEKQISRWEPVREGGGEWYFFLEKRKRGVFWAFSSFSHQLYLRKTWGESKGRKKSVGRLNVGGKERGRDQRRWAVNTPKMGTLREGGGKRGKVGVGGVIDNSSSKGDVGDRTFCVFGTLCSKGELKKGLVLSPRVAEVARASRLRASEKEGSGEMGGKIVWCGHRAGKSDPRLGRVEIKQSWEGSK